MNQFGKSCQLAICAGILFSLAATAQAEVGKAVVRAVRGQADVTQGSGRVALKTGMVLRPGAIVYTGVDSSVDLFLDRNGPVVRVMEGTTVGLDKLNFDATGADTVIETQLDLKDGRLVGRVAPMAPSSRYEIKTPQGVAGIKGTDYDITAAGVFRIINGQGVFAYRTASGSTATAIVNTGEVFTPTTGRVTPIEPGTASAVLEILDSIGIESTEVVTLVPPSEPFVSAIGDSSSGAAGTPSSD